MANTTNARVVVRDDSAAAASSPSQPQPSDEIIRNLAAFLPRDQEEYVKIREDDQYYYVKIGRSKTADQIYRPLYDRMQSIKDKYHASLHALLTQLKADQVTDTNAAVHSTPSKMRARKRPVPKSSSINKVIISRSKRTTNNTTTSISNDTTSFSSRGKSLFRGTTSKGHTTSDSINPAAIADGIENLQSFALDLMTELSIDPNTTTESASTSKVVATTITKTKKKSKKNIASSFKKPFIANEESVEVKGPVIQEESNVSLETSSGTAMKTRSRARKENTLVNSATKTITKASKDSGFSEEATSSSKSSRKVQATASPKSLKNPNAGQLDKRRSQSASNLNAAPAKKNVVDLSASGLHKAVSLNKLNTAPTTLSSSTNDGSSRSVTPKRVLTRRACAASPAIPTTPSSIAARRKEIERQERLMMSEEKSKKAEEKKKALLELRTNEVKTKREKRLGKFAENKKAIDHEKEEKLKAVWAIPSEPPTVMTKDQARNAERRLKLAQLQMEQDKANEEKKAAAAAIATTSKATGAKTLKATKTANKRPKKGVDKKQTQPKPVEVEQEPVDAPHINTQNNVAAFVMSPIAKLSGINGKINETFTVGLELNPFATPKADVSVPAGNSTFMCAPGPSSATQPAGDDGSFVMPSAPPQITPCKANGTFNRSTLQSILNSTNNYQMTPPPREITHNYDISQYIDSDDEEMKAQHEAAQCGKHVPKWCLGKAFSKQVQKQFSMPPEQLADWTRRLFPKPMLPVPLDDMGLTVREKYAQRSSSVNWKTVQKIESILEQEESKE